MEISLIIKNIIIGSLQGIFEWLPVSSEGMVSLVLISVFKEPFSKGVTVALWLHLGTLIAVMVYFWRDIRKLLNSVPGFFVNVFQRKNKPSFAPHSSTTAEGHGKATEDKNENLIPFLFISTVVTGVVGMFVLKSVFESELLGLRATFVIGFLLIITGILQKYARRKPALKSIKNLNTFDAVLLGFFQGLAALPGLSRSGLTISTLLFRGYDDKDALKISFLMSIPAVFGVVVFLLFKGGESLFNPYVLVALFFAFLFGILTIKLLMNLAARLPMWKFAIFLGVVTVLFSFLTLF